MRLMLAVFPLDIFLFLITGGFLFAVMIERVGVLVSGWGGFFLNLLGLWYFYRIMTSGMYLFFDTETTGLPRNWKAPITNFKNWPRLVQIAWILCDKKGRRLECESFIIKPENFIIPKEASNIHGISTEKAIQEGADLHTILLAFADLVDQVDYIVAHNMNFDEKILGAEFLRQKIQTTFFERPKVCTMQESTDYCKISGYYGYKWPTLYELHYKLFREGFDDAHDAAADIDATEKCFWELKKRGVL